MRQKIQNQYISIALFEPNLKITTYQQNLSVNLDWNFETKGVEFNKYTIIQKINETEDEYLITEGIFLFLNLSKISH